MTAHQQFHEGQDVEVFAEFGGGCPNGFTPICKAQIACLWQAGNTDEDVTDRDRYQVQFPDGSRAVFDAEHIRAVSP